MTSDELEKERKKKEIYRQKASSELTSKNLALFSLSLSLCRIISLSFSILFYSNLLIGYIIFFFWNMISFFII